MYNLVPRINLWRPQHLALLKRCVVLPKMHVHEAPFLRSLLDPTQLVLPLNLSGQVTSNIRETEKWFREIVFSLRPNFFVPAGGGGRADKKRESARPRRPKNRLPYLRSHAP